MIIYLIVVYAFSLAFGYVLAFTNATLALGKSLSDANTPTGYQDAITPPRFSHFAMLVYIGIFAAVAYGWWVYGWLTGLGVTVGVFVVTAVNKLLLLPKSDSNHFRRIIVHSMMNRHADYVKAADELRASAMARLLEKLGIPVEKLAAKLR